MVVYFEDLVEEHSKILGLDKKLYTSLCLFYTCVVYKKYNC